MKIPVRLFALLVLKNKTGVIDPALALEARIPVTSLENAIAVSTASNILIVLYIKVHYSERW